MELRIANLIKIVLGPLLAVSLISTGCSSVNVEPIEDPVAVEPAYNNLFKQIVSGGAATYTAGRFSCGITHTSNVICWGINDFGQLGDTAANQDSLSPVTGGDQGGAYLSNVTKIAAGRGHACALTDDGSMYCWGSGKGLGNGVNANVSEPKQVLAGEQSNTEIHLTNVVDIGVGFDFTCALISDGKVYCWGAKDFVGANISVDQYLPKTVLILDPNTSTNVPLSNIKNLAVGYRGTCGINSDHEAFCWGDKRTVGLNTKTGISRVAERPLGGEQGGAYLINIKKIAAGWNRGCALTLTDELYCWSGNTADSIPFPRKVDISDSLIDIAGGGYFSAISKNKVYLLNTDNAIFSVTTLLSPFADQPGSDFKNLYGNFESFWAFDEKGHTLFFGSSYFKTFRNPDGSFLEGSDWTQLLLMEYLF